MKLKFTKMHGAGNDFIVIDAVNQQLELAPAQWQPPGRPPLRHRRRPDPDRRSADRPGCDFRYRIFNNDGGEVEQCGNGSRAFVRFVSDKGLTAKRSIRVQTMAGIITPRLEDDGSVTVDMGAPMLEAGACPLRQPGPGRCTAGPRYLVAAHGAARAPSRPCWCRRSRWAIRTRCRWSTTSTPRRCGNRPADRTPPALPEARQCRLPAGAGPPSRQAARVRTRRRRNPGLRHRRLRGRGGRHPPRPAGLAGAGRGARRPPEHRLGRRRPAGLPERPGRNRVRRARSKYSLWLP
jgi:hypothetical protein